MTIAEQIAIDQAAALRTIKRVAESLPGYTHAEDSNDQAPARSHDAGTPGEGEVR